MFEYDHFAWRKEYSIPISALQHYAYCSRQSALIHVEEIYEENIFTLEGNAVHERVDNASNYYNKDKECENSVPVWSDTYGLYGVIDLVEFSSGNPYPVEFKRGKKKAKVADKVQLCAQVICLEEMYQIEIDLGYIYYNKSRQRVKVDIKKELREKTIDVIAGVREQIEKQLVPAPNYSKKCKNCSLKELCLPDLNERLVKYKKLLEVGN
ncbi:CRISPR-associated protein Cas4 [Fuchsiella alkaliacetigena]|uniref:CRISPR-associated protein Cas4 n=1 Tax=Fuchsiella alkaliacetigena TaxID=957042 RepID=UPI00200AECE4|nr:CRISPR-associated protein Cas4 [Fuchsiella alkaliacetigena]MCK8824001.1 CRISPR-associated protein Cas4 [Fuchsiella alkaliacetigena]